MSIQNKSNRQGVEPRRSDFIAGLRLKGWSHRAAAEAWMLWRHGKSKSSEGLVSTDDAEPVNYARAARFIGVSEGTLRHWISTGLNGVPFIKYGRGGGRVRFLLPSLAAWRAARERGGSQSTAPEAR